MLTQQIQPFYVIDSNIEYLTDGLGGLKDKVTRIDYKAWLANQVPDPNGIIVLRTNGCSLSSEKLLNAIAATPNSSYFFIVHYPITDEGKKILDRCTDHCRIPIDMAEFTYRLERLQQLHTANRLPERQVIENSNLVDFNLIGQSKEFQKVLAFTNNAANCDAPVLIEGETGCGKEMIARAIHYLGSRMGHPFIPINCGAVPDHLIENELFGHEKGAYTDAKQRYIGAIEQADAGTLFLDEIEALTNKGQVALLRFLEDKIIKPLGSQKNKKVDVRIIVASNLPLTELVGQYRFRQDLLFRLNLLHIKVPPLRMRENDILCLTEFFMQKFRKIYQQPEKELDSKTLGWIHSHHWPGNVRELENFVHRQFLLAGDDFNEYADFQKDADELSHKRRKLFDRRLHFNFDSTFNEGKMNVIDHFEKQYLTWLIGKTGGNVTRAASIAEKERRAVGKLLKKHGINPANYHHS